jgi:hypothetical protein
MKKDTWKWCEFHKIPYNDIDECHSKKSLMSEMKASESKLGFEYELDLDNGKWSIHV